MEALYPEDLIFYLEDRERDTYRLVLPDTPGIVCGDLTIIESEQQVKVFLSTVRALKRLHELNLICLDLTLYNQL